MSRAMVAPRPPQPVANPFPRQCRGKPGLYPNPTPARCVRRSRQELFPRMRPARALIDLEALRHNYRLARRLGGGRALAVVKADAYGHGAARCAAALEAEA